MSQRKSKKWLPAGTQPLGQSSSTQQIKGQIAEVSTLIKQMKDYSAQIQGIFEGAEDPPSEHLEFAEGGKLSEASSIWHLESYRSRLMSRLSRDDVISGLRVVTIPEVFADPPVFSLSNFLRDPDDK